MDANGFWEAPQRPFRADCRALGEWPTRRLARAKSPFLLINPLLTRNPVLQHGTRNQCHLGRIADSRKYLRRVSGRVAASVSPAGTNGDGGMWRSHRGRLSAAQYSGVRLAAGPRCSTAMRSVFESPSQNCAGRRRPPPPRKHKAAPGASLWFK